MQRLQTVRVLWVALSASTLLFLAVVFVVEPPAAGQSSPVVLALALAAACSCIASILLPAFLYQASISKMTIDMRLEDDPRGIPGLTKRSVATDPNATLEDAVVRFQAPFMIGMALTESVAMFGFIVGFLGHPPVLYLPFFAVSWALAAYRFPSAAKILAPIEKAKGVIIGRPD